MKAEKQKTIDYAKKLYLTYDSEGNKKNSLRKICTKVAQKLHTKVAPNTIKNWAEKYEWNGINQKAKIYAIEKAKDEKFTIDEKLIEAKGTEIAYIYKTYKKIFDIASKTVSESEEITIKEAITAMKNAADIMMKINEVPEIVQNTIVQEPMSAAQLAKFNKELEKYF